MGLLEGRKSPKRPHLRPAGCGDPERRRPCRGQESCAGNAGSRPRDRRRRAPETPPARRRAGRRRAGGRWVRPRRDPSH